MTAPPPPRRYVTSHLGKLSLASLRPRSLNRVPALTGSPGKSGNAASAGTSGFVDDVMFSHNHNHHIITV